MFYQEELLDHYKNPRHHGIIMDSDFTSGSFNPSCGDSCSFSGKIESTLLKDVKQQGSGCVISQAAASMLADMVIGMQLSAILALSSDDMLDLIKIPLGPNRLRCALLPLEALQSGINEYLAKQ